MAIMGSIGSNPLLLKLPLTLINKRHDRKFIHLPLIYFLICIIKPQIIRHYFFCYLILNTNEEHPRAEVGGVTLLICPYS